jgi:prophage antirepressor-like protein
LCAYDDGDGGFGSLEHVDEEDKGVTKRDTLGGKQQLIVINESGLYALILSSKLEQARAFKRWVTSEVLPAIRKTGRYEMLPHEIRLLRERPEGEAVHLTVEADC